MLDVSQAVKEAYAGHRRKNLVIHFPSGNFEDITNENIVSGSTVLTESLCSQEKLKFGLCEAPVFECDVAGIGNIKGETIEVSQQIFALEKCVCDVDIEVFENTAETALTERVYFYNQQDLALLTPPMTIKFGVIFDSFDSDSDCYVSLVRDGYKNGTAHKVTVDNGTPVYEEYEEVLSTSGRRGYVEVTLTGPGSFSVKQVVIYGTTVSIPYGTFVVDSCKRQAGTDIRKIIAYGYTAESFLQAPKLEMLKKKYGILDRINTRSYAITSIGSSAVSYEAIVGDEGICGQFYTVSPADYFVYSDYTAGDTAVHITYRKITYITAADPGTICQISFSGSLEPYQRADELIGSQYEEIRELATSICVQITAGRTNKIAPLIRLYKDGESCRGIDLIDIYEGNGSIEYLLPVIVEINGTEYSNIDNSALLLRYVNVDGFDFEGHNVTAADNLGDNIRNDIEACLELSGVFGRVNRTGYVDVIAIPKR